VIEILGNKEKKKKESKIKFEGEFEEEKRKFVIDLNKFSLLGGLILPVPFNEIKERIK
jgi:hypothetical protein